MKSTRNLFIFCGTAIVITLIIVLYPKTSVSSPNTVTSKPTAISPLQLNDLLKNKDFALINLEVNEKIYIKNTDYEAPYTESGSIEQYLKKDITKKVIVYSKDGTQSIITVDKLKADGYKNAYYIDGGIASWIKNGYKTTEDLNMDMSNMSVGDMSMMNMKKLDLDSFKEMMKSKKLSNKIGSTTITEVSKHNNVKDCWLVISNKIYSIPNYWIEMHPGGASAITPLCGKDATEPFKAHITEKPDVVLQYFYIGELAN